MKNEMPQGFTDGYYVVCSEGIRELGCTVLAVSIRHSFI